MNPGAQASPTAERPAAAGYLHEQLAVAAFQASARLAIPLSVSALVLLSARFALPPLQDPVSLQVLPGVHLVRPLAYVALAPLSDVLDMITLMSARQHLAFVLGLLVVWGLASCLGRRGWRGAAVSLAVLLAALGLAYAAALGLPRPMAALVSADPDLLRIDFHSHTNRSKDASRGFTLERSRAWHEAGGYDVAYVTDHGSAADELASLSPLRTAGSTGLTFLPGIEVSWQGEHIGVLGTSGGFRRVLSTNLHDLDPRGFPSPESSGAREPVLVWNHPRDPRLHALPFEGDAPAGVRALEVSNGAPHGMDLVRGKRARIIALARAHGLALTAGTDNHGWGQAAPNWTLMTLPGWRRLDREQLAAAIAQVLREEGPAATHVVERTTADYGGSRAGLALSVLEVPWRMLTTLSTGERFAWLAWTWLIATLVLQWPRWRT